MGKARHYTVTVTTEKLNVIQVTEKVKALFGEDKVEVFKVSLASSRSERYEEAKKMLEEAQSEFEQLRDELQDWKDNLPENLQNGNKADEIDNAISELESVISDTEQAAGYDIMFPGAY